MSIPTPDEQPLRAVLDSLPLLVDDESVAVALNEIPNLLGAIERVRRLADEWDDTAARDTTFSGYFAWRLRRALDGQEETP